jgi:hypothetical protein
VLLLVAKSSAQVRQLRAEGFNVGRLLGPRDRKPDVEGLPWAADNDAFNGFAEERYLRMIEAIKGAPGCLFVTAPDVVGDRDGTLELWQLWSPLIADRGLPPAYVLQDGEDGTTIPLSAKAAFLGGTTEYKMGEQGWQAAQAARARGLSLHVGRVNTLRRIRHAQRLGADSIDGTKWSLFMDTYKHQLHTLEQGTLT